MNLFLFFYNKFVISNLSVFLIKRRSEMALILEQSDEEKIKLFDFVTRYSIIFDIDLNHY